jgi:multiple sugar transport system permease protein
MKKNIELTLINNRKYRPGWIRHLREKILKLTLTILLTVFGLAIVFPFIWTISASFKYERDVLAYPPSLIPENPTLDNYEYVLGLIPDRQPRVSLLRAYRNSLLVSIPGVIGPLTLAITAAYAFSRLKFPGRDALFLLYLGTMVVPLQVLIIPRFMMANWLGIYNTHWALLIPYLVEVYAVFLLRQSFLSIPQDLIDAARIDGAGHLKIIRHVIIPASGAVIASLALLLFVWRWNDFTMPLIMLNRPQLYTLPMAIAALKEDETVARTAALTAGIVISTMPIIIAFIAANKKFIRSMVHTGVKG